MTNAIKLEAKLRQVEKKAELKKQKMLPAVIYGPKLKENILIKIDKVKFDKVYEKSGESSLIDLAINEGDTYKVIVKSIQHDPIKDSVIHVDFYQVDMTKKITTDVNLNYIGESKALKELGGNLVKSFDFVEITCLPGDLINQIDVDLTQLKTYEDAITIADLQVPENIKLTQDSKIVIATVVPPKVEEEKVAPATEAVAKEGEVKEKSEEASKEKK